MAERGDSQEEPEPASQQGDFPADEREALKQLAQSPGGKNIETLPRSTRDPDLAREEDKQDILLKRAYGIVLLLILIVQVVVANYMFFRYARDGVSWQIDPGVMRAWLAATVIELIGITAIVVRHLFPKRGDPQVTLPAWVPRRRKR